MTIKYPLATTSWDQAEIDAMQEVIASGNFTMGKHVKKFEEDFASYFGSKYAIMSNSGSSANLLMIGALFFRKDNPIKAGDEVIVPAVSWSTTYMPLQQYGLKVKFVDIDLHTLNFDLEQLKSAVTDQTRIILAVNLLGNPNDFNAISEIIGSRNIILLEDNCESMGARYEGQMAGSIGLMGTFSTFFSHHMSTMEGGMTITNDEELYHIMLSLRSHGWTRHLPKENKVTGTKSDDEFEESFKFVLPGYNLRPLELSGAIGLKQLPKLQSFVDYRRSNAALFVKLFKDHPNLIIQKEIGESSWFGFSFIIDPASGIDRRQLLKKLKQSGIETRPIVAGNFAKNATINHFNYEIHDTLKNADLIDKFGFFVGNHHFDLTEEIKFLETALK
jgi:CDP-4-dehydro-6-deoxyglucose reductase, E1